MAAPERRRAEVITPFGGPVEFLPSEPTTTAAEDMELVRRKLKELNEGGAGFLRIYRPKPTAAFSPRDTTLSTYAAAAAAMQLRGFVPVERRAGGQLALYDGNALIIDLVASHNAPREDVVERFRLFSGTIAGALCSLGIDARVGEVAGEYCPGDYSVNAEGRVKLAGIAQRIARCGYHLGAVISVLPSDQAKAAVAEAYRVMGLAFEPATFGAVADLVPEPDFAKLTQNLREALGEVLPVTQQSAAA